MAASVARYSSICELDSSLSCFPQRCNRHNNGYYWSGQLRLSKWAEGYEQAQGQIRCPRRVTNNAQRVQGKRVVDGRGR